MTASPPPMAENTPIECGREAAKEFEFAEGYTNLNHGSFGAAPRAVRVVQRAYQDRSYAAPDPFIRYEYPPLLDASRAAIAKYVNAPPSTCVFVPNATTGVNTILRNLTWQPGDVIILLSTIYGACEKTALYLAETTPVTLHKIPYTYPLSDTALTTLFTNTIDHLRAHNLTPKLALFDTLASVPGVAQPHQTLTTLCAQHSILSLIDAAHTLGHHALDLSTLNPDFLVSNAHKWLHVPRSCALLYVPARNQHLMRSTLPTSHSFRPLPSAGPGPPDPLPPPAAGKGKFESDYDFVATLDNTPFLCVPAALAWRARLTYGALRGEEAVFAYLRTLAREGGRAMAAALGTEVLENEEGTLGACGMSNVRLPLGVGEVCGGEGEVQRVVQFVMRQMFEREGVFVMCVFYGGAWWVRVSAQVYLTLEDFERAGRGLVGVCERVRKGEWKS